MLCVGVVSLKAQYNMLTHRFLSKDRAMVLSVFENENCDRRMVLQYEGKTLLSDSLFSCCVCGGKINEPLDSVYINTNTISIVQKNDSYKDSLVFTYRTKTKNYVLSSLYRTPWQYKPRVKVFTPLKGKVFTIERFAYVNIFSELDKNRAFTKR
jgi:hypothetical protein